MYSKLVLATCVLAFCAVVFSAYARLSDAGLGCTNWPACYEENALKQRQPPQPDVMRKHESWRWRLQNQAGLLLGILSIAICGYAWQKRRELRQSPLLPTLLVALMAFLAAFGIWAFSFLPRAVIVPVHLAGGITTLIVLVWIALCQMKQTVKVSASEAQNWRVFSRLGLALVLVQIMLGGWVSSNFAALACIEFPLCQGSLLPMMDFSYSLDRYGLPLSVEKLTAIHWTHRAGAVITLIYLGWLCVRIMAVQGLHIIGKVLLGVVVFQFVLGVSNVLLGLPLFGAVLHNAVAMLLLVTLLLLNYTLQKQEK
ncbi:MAG: COX15/CtaA family protein [Sideroxyarcus sp.]|nr:COX15/CtaA family protein [Sideroxyarcus sp.]